MAESTEMNGGSGEANSGLKITALSLPDASRVLSRVCGRSILESTLKAHVDAGAPLNADGTINLVAYAAWLARDLAHAD